MKSISSSLNGSIRNRTTSKNRRESERSEKEDETKQKAGAKLTEIEDAATGAVGFKVYWRYFQSIGLWMSLGAIISNAINSGAGIFSSSKSSFKVNFAKKCLKFNFCKFGSNSGQATVVLMNNVKLLEMSGAQIISGEIFTWVFMELLDSSKVKLDIIVMKF